MTIKITTPDGLLDAAAALDSAVAEVRAPSELKPALGAERAQSAVAAESAGAAVASESAHPADAIAQALGSHEISPERAVELLLEHSLAAVDGAPLSRAEEAAMRAHVQALLTSDPHLAGLCAALGQSAPTDNI